MFSKARQVWRTVREMDFDAIRRRAEAPARITVIADARGEAERLAERLDGDGWPGNEALRLLDLAETSSPASALAQAGPEAWVDLAVLVAREPGLSDSLVATRRALAAARVPVVTVIIGAAPGDVGTATAGERARVGVPSLDGQSLARLAPALLEAVPPDGRLALARRFPRLRPAVFDALIAETSKANAGYAFTTGLAEVVPALTVPANLGDIVILTKNQLIMSYRLALAAGKDGKPRQVVGEIVGVLGGGLLLRQVARELVGLVPVIGIVPKVAVAYAGTWAIGHAIVLWAAEGRRVSRRSFRTLFHRGLTQGREMAGSLAATRAS